MQHFFSYLKIQSFLFISCLMILHNCQAETIAQQTPSPEPSYSTIVKCSLIPTRYERVLMTQLRNKNTTQEQFRNAADKLSELLVSKVVECLNSTTIEIETPLAPCEGELINDSIEFVSVMRSGDALLPVFSKHFPQAPINKILIQRNEENARPIFYYTKFSPKLSCKGAKETIIIITEPMIATGNTLVMTINLLKEHGIEEKNIIIAAICAAPEGLNHLKEEFPQLKIVLIAIDSCLNDKSYIVPGIGDFGDRYFGTK